MTTHENWKAIPGYEGFYEVSDQGRVRSLDRIVAHGRSRKGQFLSPDRGHRGHLQVTLYKNGKRERMFVHRLVLLAFIGPCPEGMEACHWNDISDDNRLENLRWDTPSANRHDSLRNGRHYNANKTKCPRGHVYVPENTYVEPSGKRQCRECGRIRDREYYRLNAEKIKANVRRSKRKAVLA